MLASRRTLASVTLGAVLASSMALAQSGTAPAPGKPAVTTTSTAAAASASAIGRPDQGDWWAEADRDGDGRLSIAEATANPSIATRFTAIDANSDGFVTQEEYRVYFTAGTGARAGQPATHTAVLTRDLWLALDTDADSRISLAEAAGDAALRSEFTVIDANTDGFVVQDEYTLYAQARR